MVVELFKLIPMYVAVNLETGEIDRVIVNDEAEPVYPWDHSEAQSNTGRGDYRVSTPEEITAALRIIDDGAEWPAWEFGG